MTAPAQLGLVELDLLATHAGASVPFPLRVPSFGRIQGERDELFSAAGQTLMVRDLAGEDGPTGVAAELVIALAGRRGTVDLVITGSGSPVGLVGILYGTKALVCRQAFGDEQDPLVEVRSVRPDELAGTLLALIPPLPGAKSMPIRLPAPALRAAQAELAGGADEFRLRQLVMELGGQADDLDALIAATGEVTGSGQLGAMRGDVRAGTELSWWDTPNGRFRVSLHADWVSVNPLRPNDLHAAVRDLVELASGSGLGR